MSNPSLSQFIVNHPLMLELQDRLEKEWAEKIQKEHASTQKTTEDLKDYEVRMGLASEEKIQKEHPTQGLAIEQVIQNFEPKEFIDGKAAGSCDAKMENVLPGYDQLGRVLAKALDQAQNGKGNQRHQVGDVTFVDQPICGLTRLYGLAYPFGQAAKKVHEVGQLERKEAKLAEVLGAINYLAAAYIVINEGE